MQIIQFPITKLNLKKCLGSYFINKIRFMLSSNFEKSDLSSNVEKFVTALQCSVTNGLNSNSNNVVLILGDWMDWWPASSPGS